MEGSVTKALISGISVFHGHAIDIYQWVLRPPSLLLCQPVPTLVVSLVEGRHDFSIGSSFVADDEAPDSP